MITKGEHKEDILPFTKKFTPTFSEIWTDGHFAY